MKIRGIERPSRPSLILFFLSSELWASTLHDPMDILSSLDAELTARSTWMPNIESLDFVNDPITSGQYRRQNPDQLMQPNAGLYALRLVSKNQVYLEYENRLCDILYTLERMEPSDAKEDMENRILQELARINTLKEFEWLGQRSVCCIKGAASVVNTGVSICLHSCCAAVAKSTPTILQKSTL